MGPTALAVVRPRLEDATTVSVAGASGSPLCLLLCGRMLKAGTGGCIGVYCDACVERGAFD